jgi:hypothetical protein
MSPVKLILADSPKNLQAVVTAAVDLLNSRLSAIEDKWKNTFFFEDDEEFPVLSDKSKDVVGRLGAGGTVMNQEPTQGNEGWTQEKEARFQELLMKRNKNGS